MIPEVTMVPADLASDAGTVAGTEAPAETAAVVSPGGFGVLQGQVVFKGTAPTLAAVPAGTDMKDKEVCAAVDRPDDRLVVGSGGGVANVFIYLQKAPAGGKAWPADGEDVIFDQKNCRFEPHCLVVPTGRTVKVLSNDAIAHNTHTYPSKNDAVNSGVAPNDRTGALNFKYRRPEAVPLTVTCDYHAWMKAFHLPIDHPYAAVTDAEGKFSIPDLPAGTHSFVVWHESVEGNFLERKLSVTVSAGETKEVQIEMPAEKLAKL